MKHTGLQRETGGHTMERGRVAVVLLLEVVEEDKRVRMMEAAGGRDGQRKERLNLFS